MPPRLTELLRPFKLAERVEKRRRIEAMADRWADYLRTRHDRRTALAHCRRKMAFCAARAPGVRRIVWIKVFQRLR